MTTHLIISTDQLTNSVMIGTGAFPKKSANGDPYFAYMTAIISTDPLIEERVFVWGTTPGEFISPKMIEHSTKGHHRVLAIVLLYCAWKDPFSLLLDLSRLKNYTNPLIFKA